MKQNLILQVGVKSFLVNKDNKMLFLKRSTNIYGKSGNIWDLPGGRIDSRETLLEALKREIKEETAINSFKVLSLVTVQDLFRWSDKHVVRVTYISRVTKSKVSLSEEHDDFKWVSIKEALKLNLDEYVRDIIKDKKHMSFINSLIN